MFVDFKIVKIMSNREKTKTKTKNKHEGTDNIRCYYRFRHLSNYPHCLTFSKIWFFLAFHGLPF